MAVIGGFRSDLSIARILETFPRVFCFPKSRINENGGKLIMKPFEFRELLRENLHGAVHEALKKVTTDQYERNFQVHCGYVNIKNSLFVLITF